MPAGSIELYVPKKNRIRYTIALQDSIENINQEYYGNPKSKEVIKKYRKYFLSHNIDVEDLYQKHMYKKDKDRQELWCSLPPDVRRYFHKIFQLNCPCLTKTLVVKRIY